jgi:spermidine/putrescine-binding protein
MKGDLTRQIVREVKDGRMSRRRLLQTMASVGVAAVSLPTFGSRAFAEDQLLIQTWSGYDIEELAPTYYAAHGKPDFSLMGSDEEGFQKVASGFKPDMTHHTSFMVGKLHDAGLIQPIDTNRLTYWNDFFPELQQVENVDGKMWIAPFSWGNSSVIYRKDLIEPKEESWGVLWDEDYAGRIGMRDAVEGLLIVGGLYTGAVDPWGMTDPEIAKTREALLKQKPLSRFYWNSQTDMEQAFATDELVAAYGWNASVALLRSQGIDMAMMKPKEGIITWTDGLVLYKDHPHSEDLAYEYINAYMSPEVGEFLINAYGYGSGNIKAYDKVPAARLEELGITDPGTVLATSRFQKEVDPTVRQKYQAVFDEVKIA